MSAGLRLLAALTEVGDAEGDRDRIERLARELEPAMREIAREEIAAVREEAECLSAEEVARFLGVDRKTIYESARRKEIPHRKMGKRLVFSRSAVVAWLGGCKTASHRERK